MVLLTFPGARIQLDWLYVAQMIVQRWIEPSLIMPRVSFSIKIIDTSVIDQFMDGCFEGVAVGSGNRAAGNKGNH